MLHCTVPVQEDIHKVLILGAAFSAMLPGNNMIGNLIIQWGDDPMVPTTAGPKFSW